jgi:hypothetical protein
VIRLPLSGIVDKIAFLDPASGKRLAVKRVRARSAIVVVGIDDLTRIFVLHAWADRVPTSVLMDTVMSVQTRFGPRVFGCEANAMQGLFADAIRLEAQHRAVTLPLVAVEQSTHIDKDVRIRTALQPVIAWGRLFLRRDHVELRAELESFPMSATKDLVDALASAVALAPARPAPRVLSDERDAFATYLREMGVDPWEITERIGAFDRGESAWEPASEAAPWRTVS